MSNTNDFIIENGVLKEYLGKDKKVIVPDGVVALSPKVFAWSNENIKEVVIPVGITEIPEECFFDCKFIESIHLPDSIKTIGEKAFWKCLKLKEIIWPACLENICENAFWDCKVLILMLFPIH